MTTHLPDDVRALLQAAVDAIDVPLPARADHHATRAFLLSQRACDTRIILAAVLKGEDIGQCAAQLSRWASEKPVTYRPWQAPEVDSSASDAGAPVIRCGAAHPDDPTLCDGPAVVTVLDPNNAGVDGCEHHGARLLASLEGGRVYRLPDAPEGAAVRVHKAAGGIRPFAWLTNAPRTEPSQLSHAENRQQNGEGRS